MASNGNISAYQCRYFETLATTSPPPPHSHPGRAYLGIRPFFCAKGEGHFREGGSAVGGISASQFKYLGDDIDRRITDVRRGRKRVPICKGGVVLERTSNEAQIGFGATV